MKMSRVEYSISKKVGLAINRYDMISSGDKVLVALSGGKDSLTLLRILHQRRRWLPIDYTIKAVHVITDYDHKPQVKRDTLKEYCESLGCECFFKEIAIAEKNKLGNQDCFWCSWNRRKALFRAAEEMGFNKIAFGHHKDDIVETILMNMIFNAEVSSINPVQRLFGGKLMLIRPLVFLEEMDTARYVKEVGLPEIKSSCPKSLTSKRAVIKDIVARLARDNRDIKNNILKAPHRIKADYISDILEEEVMT
ncbi:tRNA 2-thiocytidine biosynthesis TtcA family protein [Candidatus Omnitrophota bacterium]